MIVTPDHEAKWKTRKNGKGWVTTQNNSMVIKSVWTEIVSIHANCESTVKIKEKQKPSIICLRTNLLESSVQLHLESELRSTARVDLALGIVRRKPPPQPWSPLPAAGTSLPGIMPEQTPSEWLWDPDFSAPPQSVQCLRKNGKHGLFTFCLWEIFLHQFLL